MKTCGSRSSPPVCSMSPDSLQSIDLGPRACPEHTPRTTKLVLPAPAPTEDLSDRALAGVGGRGEWVEVACRTYTVPSALPSARKEPSGEKRRLLTACGAVAAEPTDLGPVPVSQISAATRLRQTSRNAAVLLRQPCDHCHSGPASPSPSLPTDWELSRRLPTPGPLRLASQSWRSTSSPEPSPTASWVYTGGLAQ